MKITLSFQVQGNEENDSTTPPDRAALEDMVRRWDFSRDEWACRDLLFSAFPEVTGFWSEEEREEMDTMDVLVGTCQHSPQKALQMIKLLLNTAEPHLQESEAANQLLGWDMLDTLGDNTMLPLLVEELKQNNRLARQLFQSAYVGQPQKSILQACYAWGETTLLQKLLELLKNNPFPHDPIFPEQE